MSELVLYQEYRWHDAVGLFGSTQDARVLCDGQWVIFPEAMLCLTTLGDPPNMPYFEVASRFWWVCDKPPIPPETIAALGWHPTIHFFVRNVSRQTYMYLGRSGPSHQQAYPRPPAYVAAEFDLRPALPSRIWQSLGGFNPGSLDHDRIDNALRQLDGETATEDRLAVLRDVVHY